MNYNHTSSSRTQLVIELNSRIKGSDQQLPDLGIFHFLDGTRTTDNPPELIEVAHSAEEFISIKREQGLRAVLMQQDPVDGTELPLHTQEYLKYLLYDPNLDLRIGRFSKNGEGILVYTNNRIEKWVKSFMNSVDDSVTYIYLGETNAPAAVDWGSQIDSIRDRFIHSLEEVKGQLEPSSSSYWVEAVSKARSLMDKNDFSDLIKIGKPFTVLPLVYPLALQQVLACILFCDMSGIVNGGIGTLSNEGIASTEQAYITLHKVYNEALTVSANCTAHS